MNKLPMTAAGHLVLEEELRHRIQVERPRLIQRIQGAIADDSNLAENSEYQAAKTEQEINENRIADLEDKLARAEVIDVSKLSGDAIKFGATVDADGRGYRRKEGMADRWRARSRRTQGENFSDITDRACADRKG
jgi:transcription elongation GreA/GreB family factor